MFRVYTLACRHFARVIDGMNTEYIWGHRNTGLPKVTKTAAERKGFLYFFPLQYFARFWVSYSAHCPP